MSEREDGEAARERRLDVLRGLAASAAPAPAPEPPRSAPSLEREFAGVTGAPPRMRRRWPVIAGIIAAALVIEVIGPIYALFHLHHPPAATTPTAHATAILSSSLAAATLYLVASGTAQSYIYALNAQTSATRWRFPFAGSNCAPVLAGGVLYVGSKDGLVYALDATTGQQRWVANLGTGNGAYVTVASGRVFIADGFDFVYALDAVSGKQLWKHAGGFHGVVSSSPPAVAHGLVYVASGDYPTGRGIVTAFDVATGKTRWQAATGFAASGAPVVADSTVYVTTNDGTIWALDAKTGAKVWSQRLTAPFAGGVVVDEGLLYAEGEDGSLYALDRTSGVQDWSATERDSTGLEQHVSPLVANGVVYVGSRDGLFSAFDAQSGALKWRYQTTSPFTSTPVLRDGALYVCNGASGLLALHVASGTLAWNLSLDDSADALAIAP